MEKLELEISSNLFIKADNFTKFRNGCKEYLTTVGASWNKFTIVSHDSFIGYITENVILSYLGNKNPKLQIETWEDQFDIPEIIRIIKEKDYSSVSKELVISYFYDKWDIKINSKEIIFLSDVKTALTLKIPNEKWNFMYPVIQANKIGKDIMILVYYVVTDLKDPKSFQNLYLIGYTTPDTIKKCPIVKAGNKTIYGTISQIDNYITELSKDYFNLNDLINNY
jgi:hypothetical protein